MKTRNYLLPYSYKRVGMWMFLPFAAICICLLFSVKLPSISVPWIAIGDSFFYKGKADLLTEVGMMGLLVSFCFIALSKAGRYDIMLLVCGADAGSDEAQALCNSLQKQYRRTEVIMIDGGQPIYDYIIILE